MCVCLCNLRSVFTLDLVALGLNSSQPTYTLDVRVCGDNLETESSVSTIPLMISFNFVLSFVLVCLSVFSGTDV